jgi:hypothetical protein
VVFWTGQQVLPLQRRIVVGVVPTYKACECRSTTGKLRQVRKLRQVLGAALPTGRANHLIVD